jgi:hypothetical protein
MKNIKNKIDIKLYTSVLTTVDTGFIIRTDLHGFISQKIRNYVGAENCYNIWEPITEDIKYAKYTN